MKINNKIKYNIFLESSSIRNFDIKKTNRNIYTNILLKFIFILALSVSYTLSVGFIIGGFNYILNNLNRLSYLPNDIILHYIGIASLGMLLLIINLLFTSNIFKKIK